MGEELEAHHSSLGSYCVARESLRSLRRIPLQRSPPLLVQLAVAHSAAHPIAWICSPSDGAPAAVSGPTVASNQIGEGCPLPALYAVFTLPNICTDRAFQHVRAKFTAALTTLGGPGVARTAGCPLVCMHACCLPCSMASSASRRHP